MPTAVEGSSGVNRKWLAGDMTRTSYSSLSSLRASVKPPHPEPRISTRGFILFSKAGALLESSEVEGDDVALLNMMRLALFV